MLKMGNKKIYVVNLRAFGAATRPIGICKELRRQNARMLTLTSPAEVRGTKFKLYESGNFFVYGTHTKKHAMKVLCAVMGSMRILGQEPVIHRELVSTSSKVGMNVGFKVNLDAAGKLLQHYSKYPDTLKQSRNEIYIRMNEANAEKVTVCVRAKGGLEVLTGGGEDHANDNLKVLHEVLMEHAERLVHLD
jgi:hypothetical protein